MIKPAQKQTINIKLRVQRDHELPKQTERQLQQSVVLYFQSIFENRGTYYVELKKVYKEVQSSVKKMVQSKIENLGSVYTIRSLDQFIDFVHSILSNNTKTK